MSRHMIVKILNTKRLPYSTNGNPRYMVYTTGGAFRTKPDSQVGYIVDNFYLKTVHLTLNGRNQVVDLEEAPEVAQGPADRIRATSQLVRQSPNLPSLSVALGGALLGALATLAADGAEHTGHEIADTIDVALGIALAS